VVVAADCALTPMDSRPVGTQLEATLARTAVRRGAGEAFLDWVRRVIGEELVRQSTNEYLSAALEAITGRVKAAIDPNVVKEINCGGAAQPVLAETDVFQLLYNLLKDRGCGHLSQAKRLLAGLPQSSPLDRLTGRTPWGEVVRRAVDAYANKLTDWAALQSMVSMPLILFDAVLPMFPTSAETASVSYTASERVTGLLQWRDENSQATARECMARLQAESNVPPSRSRCPDSFGRLQSPMQMRQAAAHVDQPRGRSETRGRPGSRPGTPAWFGESDSCQMPACGEGLLVAATQRRVQ
jgi:hypothetical protein